MNAQQDLQAKKQSLLCSRCASFYGSQAHQGLCSSCHKQATINKKEEITMKSPQQTLTPVSVPDLQLVNGMQELCLQNAKKEQKDKKRCFDCNKKTGLLGIECKCGYVFCNSHRLPEDHKCNFDFKIEGKDRLKKQIVKVYKGKIEDF